MKIKFILLSILSVFLVSIFSCKKGELLQPEATNVIKLAINGNTTQDLEFIYKDSVIASGKASQGKFIINTLLKVGAQDALLQVRKKGTSEIIKTQTIKSAPFDQTISIYYDGTKIYNGAVDYRIKGYAISGELEFLLDGQVIASGSGKIDNTVSFGIDENSTRKIEVRIKGETAILTTKMISASPAAQSLGFLFDGIEIVDNIKLDPPSNPANMAISAQFKTSLPDKFNGKDIDLVFYTKNYSTDETTKVTPEIRIPLPKNGAFVTFELPPLPADSYYTCDIFERGTNTVPYDLSNLIFPLVPNNGYNSVQWAFGENRDKFHEPGTSKLIQITDGENLVFSPDLGTVFYSDMTDLSQYFQ